MKTLPFQLDVSGAAVPGILFLPTHQDNPVPLVLAQHGGSSHKHGADILDWAELFVRENGMALASIDGPVHGDRLTSGTPRPGRSETRAAFLALWKSPGGGIRSMVRDWRAVLDWLSTDARIDSNAVAWLGLSMGTAYGVPLLAAEPRIKAAVLGMWGLSFANSEHLALDAPRIGCPVLFQQKWDDELVPREGQIALFERIGSSQKWLSTYPGQHVPVQGQQMNDLVAFLLRHLLAVAPPQNAGLAEACGNVRLLANDLHCGRPICAHAQVQGSKQA